MKRYLIGSGFAGALLLAASVGAQYPPTSQPSPTTPSTKEPAAQEAKAVTVEGCLVREADVPGRKPNVAERAGLGEDYILTSTKVVKGSAPGSASSEARPGTPTGTSGTQAAMYQVKGIDDEQLKSNIGKRVQIVGTFENTDRATASPDKAAAADELIELRGTTLTAASGDCPAK
jgi:hypothetical protein